MRKTFKAPPISLSLWARNVISWQSKYNASPPPPPPPRQKVTSDKVLVTLMYLNSQLTIFVGILRNQVFQYSKNMCKIQMIYSSQNPRSDRVAFVLDKVVMGQFYLLVHRLYCVNIVPPMVHAHSFITKAI